MAKDKRKTTPKHARKASKKAKGVKKPKLKSAAKARPAAKKKAKVVRAVSRPARKPVKRVAAKKPAHGKRPVQAKKTATQAKVKPARKPAAVAPEAKAGKKAKATIPNTKQALELLEAKVNAGLKAVKEKKGRGGRRARREEWLAAAAELPKEDAEARRTRLKTLIKLGKDRVFPLLFVEMENDLGVSLAAEPVSRLELSPQLPKVVDLAVEDEPE